MVHRGHKVSLEAEAIRDRGAIRELEETLVPPEALDHRVRLVTLGCRDLWDHLEPRDQLVQLEHREVLDSRVREEMLVLRVSPDSQEAQVPLDLQGFKDQLDSEEIQGPEGMLDFPGLLDLQGHLGHQENLVRPASEVRQVSQDQQGPLVLQGLLATGVTLADQAPVGPGEIRGILVQLEVKVLWVILDNGVILGNQGQRGFLVVLVRGVFQVTGVIQVPVDCLDCLVQMDRLDLLDHPVLRVWLVQWD